MTKKSLKLLVLPVVAGALFISACGKKSETSEETVATEKKFTYPDAPADAIKMILGELAEGNGEVLWQAMPASYQDDGVFGGVHLGPG